MRKLFSIIVPAPLARETAARGAGVPRKFRGPANAARPALAVFVPVVVRPGVCAAYELYRHEKHTKIALFPRIAATQIARKLRPKIFRRFLAAA